MRTWLPGYKPFSYGNVSQIPPIEDNRKNITDTTAVALEAIDNSSSIPAQPNNAAVNQPNPEGEPLNVSVRNLNNQNPDDEDDAGLASYALYKLGIMMLTEWT